MKPNKFANGDIERAFKTLAPTSSHTEELIAVMLGFAQQEIRLQSITTGAGLPEAMAAVEEKGPVSAEKGPGHTESAVKPEGLPHPDKTPSD